MRELSPEANLPSSTAAAPGELLDTSEALLALGHRYLDEGNFAEAQRAFDKVLALDPANAAARHNQGYALECQGAVEEAKTAYETVLTSPTPLAQSAFNLGVLLARLGREGEAEGAFAQALALNPDLVLAHVNLGALHARAGRLEEARHAYQKARALDEHAHSARLKLAHLLAREGRWDEALSEYTQLVEEGCNLAAVHYGRGLALATHTDDAQAIQAYQHAIAADPHHVNARVNLGLLYAQRGQYEQAAETLQQVADFAPDNARMHYNLANMHARRAIEGGDLISYSYADAALTAYRRAIALDPQFTKAYYNLACVSEKISVQDGIAAWEQYVRVASKVASEQEWVAKAQGYLRRLKEIEAGC